MALRLLLILVFVNLVLVCMKFGTYEALILHSPMGRTVGNLLLTGTWYQVCRYVSYSAEA